MSLQMNRYGFQHVKDEKRNEQIYKTTHMVASSLRAGSGHGSFAIVCFGID
jgi:hypothetical protein